MIVYDLVVETVVEMRNEDRIPSFLYKQGNETETIVVKPVTELI